MFFVLLEHLPNNNIKSESSPSAGADLLHPRKRNWSLESKLSTVQFDSTFPGPAQTSPVKSSPLQCSQVQCNPVKLRPSPIQSKSSPGWVHPPDFKRRCYKPGGAILRHVHPSRGKAWSGKQLWSIFLLLRRSKWATSKTFLVFLFKFRRPERRQNLEWHWTELKMSAAEKINVWSQSKTHCFKKKTLLCYNILSSCSNNVRPGSESGCDSISRKWTLCICP